ncbi:MAG: outer membrane protein transport protein [Acidobacteriota bacterium]|nr:outer membrane protein transport protein [Acidobacteriota bacterium]
MTSSKRSGRGWGRCALAFAAAWLAAQAGWAQTDVEVNAGIEFNFSPPGARSLGAGGAFIALADDATAAFANPAGLTTISRPELSFEGRDWAYTHVFTDRGRQGGTLTGGFDNLAGLRNGEASNQVLGLAYFSLVFRPLDWDLSLALYRHELGNFRASFATQGAIIDDSTRIFPSRSELNLDLVNLGLAAGVKITEGLSAGVGLSLYSLALASLTQRYAVPAGPPYNPPTYAPAGLATSQTQKSDQSAFGFNLGLTWQASAEWQLGATFRQGPRFDLSVRTEPGPAGSPRFAAARSAQLNVPSVYGLGVAYQKHAVTLAFDYVRVNYSALTNRFTSSFASFTPEDLRHFRVDDADELHLGFQYLFKLPDVIGELHTRAGAWRDPDHRVRYDGPDPISRALFRAGSDLIHYSAGLGLDHFFPVRCLIGRTRRACTLSLMPPSTMPSA